MFGSVNVPPSRSKGCVTLPEAAVEAKLSAEEEQVVEDSHPDLAIGSRSGSGSAIGALERVWEPLGGRFSDGEIETRFV